MRTTNSSRNLIFIAILGVGVALAYGMYGTSSNWVSIWIVVGAFVVALVVARGRERISNELRKIIDERTERWGINVISVEIKDVLIPPGLEDAMSMQAQAEREREARVILGDSERQIAEKFEQAAKSYVDNPTALHLRAMNMLYEGLKENSTIVLVPSNELL